MNNLFRKNRSLFGKVFLLVLLAPRLAVAESAGNENDGLLPTEIRNLKKEAQDNLKSKCQASKQVGDGDEKCKKPYDATIKAVDDYGRKLRDDKNKVGSVAAGGAVKCANQGGAQTCQQTTNKDNYDTVKKAKSDEATANQGLADWIKRTGEEAKTVADTIRTMKQDGIASNVSEAAATEHDNANEFANKAAQKLQAEAAKNQAAAQQAEKTAQNSDKKGTNMDSTPTDKAAASKASDATKPAEQAAAGSGAGGGAPSIPSIPSAASGNPSSTPATDSAMAGQDSLARSDGTLGKNASGSKSSANDLKLDATPVKIDAASQAASGPISSTGSSKMDTSLRDSLKKKLLGDQSSGSGGGDAISGMPFGGGTGSGSKNAKPGEPGYVAGGSSSEHGGGDFGSGGSGGESGGDFSMARSETDAAVKNLINEFSGKGGEAGRSLADIENGAASGIEGIDGGNLFHRIRGTINRHLQKGDVVNGVNGKI
ncbi:MAG: hypothetical protein ACXWQO_10075 [Bdellovibrionota bacterium]